MRKCKETIYIFGRKSGKSLKIKKMIKTNFNQDKLYGAAKRRYLYSLKEYVLDNYKRIDVKDCLTLENWLWKIINSGFYVDYDIIEDEELTIEVLKIKKVCDYYVSKTLKSIPYEEPKKKFWEELK